MFTFATPPLPSSIPSLDHLFRQHWWQFWKPAMPVIRPRWVLMPTLDPADLARLLTPEQCAQLIASTAPVTTTTPTLVPVPVPANPQVQP